MPLPLCVRTPVEDTRSAEALRADGWRRIEELWTFHSPGNGGDKPGLEVLPRFELKWAECEWAAQLAARSFTQDRLHADPKVDPEEAAEFKRQWVRDAAADPGKWAVHNHERTALLIYKPGVIDLLCVAPEARGKGIGRRLVQWALAQGPCTAGTQSTNAAGINLYLTSGFQLVKRQITWHK